MAAMSMIMALLLQSEGTPPAREPPQDVDVEQLARPHAPGQDIAIPDVTPERAGNPTQIRQLPPTLDAPIGQSAGEDTLKRGEEDDRQRLAGEVARVADMLRQRGQQPTPETLAREIGPDALAEYLNVDPAMLDSYGTPPDAPLPDAPPDGGVIPPSSPR